jgi:cardiolipin synthase
MRSVKFTANNRITLLHCGAEFFPALIQAFDAALSSIYLETYIFADDATGREISNALKRAAARGIRVYVVTDWIGTGRHQCEQWHKELSAAGIYHRTFNPWFKRGVTRTHRKMCVVDRKVAFLGGLNINDDMLLDNDASVILPAPRWDFAVRIEGPLVGAIHREVTLQWDRMEGVDFKTRWEKFRETLSGPLGTLDKPAAAALIVRDNLRNRRTIQKSYLQALGNARNSAWLANPYFAPNRKMRDALSAAARRGVKVTLLLGVGQFAVQDAVAQSYYPQLLKSGVRIFEYRKTQLHGKVAVVDDQWATVGSANYDGLSLFVNQEANIVINDATFARSLREHIEHGVADAVPINPEEFVNIPWYRRIWNRAAYLIYKNAMRLITLGKYTE